MPCVPAQPASVAAHPVPYSTACRNLIDALRAAGISVNHQSGVGTSDPADDPTGSFQWNRVIMVTGPLDSHLPDVDLASLLSYCLEQRCELPPFASGVKFVCWRTAYSHPNPMFGLLVPVVTLTYAGPNVPGVLGLSWAGRACLRGRKSPAAA